MKGSAEALSSASVVYTYHQHSTSTATQTVEQSTTPYSGTSAASYVSTSGGCYTKPYYYYKKVVHHAAVPSHTEVCGYWQNNGDDSCTCSGCGYTQYGCSQWSNGLPWGSSTHTKSVKVKDAIPAQPAYYSAGCGHTNGEIISIEIQL